MNSYQLAVLFHDTYERLAPSFGYVTREDTREFNPNSINGKLMLAVCEEINSQYKQQLAAAEQRASEAEVVIAERDELREQLDHCQQRYHHVSGCLQLSNENCTVMIRKLDSLRECVALYADQNNWEEHWFLPVKWSGVCGYEPAQAALAKVGEMK